MAEVKTEKENPVYQKNGKLYYKERQCVLCGEDMIIENFSKTIIKLVCDCGKTTNYITKNLQDLWKILGVENE